MKYDPCGRIVAMVRRPYRTACRFFSDSDLENTIHWYIVPPSNGTLPYPHRIIPCDWFPDRVNNKTHGEHSLEERPFDGWLRITPPVPTDHICGTREDFSNGCSISDPRPPLVRAVDGIPSCCRPIQNIQGVVLGGSAPVANPVGAAVLGGEQNANAGYGECIGQGIQAADGLPRYVLPIDTPFAQYIGITPGAFFGATVRWHLWDASARRTFLVGGGPFCGFEFFDWNQTVGPGSQYYTVTQTIPAGATLNVVLAQLPSPPLESPWLIAVEVL